MEKTRRSNHGPNRIKEKPKNLSVSIKKMVNSLNRYYKLIILALLLASLGSVLAIIGPNKISELTNTVLHGIANNIDIDKIKKISLFLLIIYLLSALFNYFQNFIMVIVSNQYAKELRTKLIDKINKLPLKYFDNHLTGDILSRMTNDIDTIGMMMQQSLGTLVGAITLFLGSIIMMFITNWIMALTGILSSLIGFFIMGKIMSKSQKFFNQRQQFLGDLNSHIEEVYSNYIVVNAYNGQEIALDKFDDLNEKVYKSNQMSQFLSGLMGPLMGFIGDFSYVAVCIVGSILVLNGFISFGTIVAFMIYIRLFINPLNQITQGLTSMQTTLAASERIFEILEEEEVVDKKKKNKIIKDNIKGNIEFKNVKFGYNDNLVIKNFNIRVKKGQKIAIVGPTGAGKTTLVNLLMRFYDINEGDILIDDVSIRDLTRENVRELFIMVLQDTWLFNGTIKDNIKYNSNASDKEIWNALKMVGIDHFVKTLPKTINYEINDSDSISQGQKQLLTIARGLIKNAPFLILDEATSSVDTRTEEQVQKAMDKLMEGRTSFIIAHRLSTIKNADIILVLKDGNIVEQGNHKSLLKKDGFYAKLYNSQFEN